MLKLWDITTKTCIKTYTTDGEYINCGDINVEGSILAYGDDEGTLHIWDT